MLNHGNPMRAVTLFSRACFTIQVLKVSQPLIQNEAWCTEPDTDHQTSCTKLAAPEYIHREHRTDCNTADCQHSAKPACRSAGAAYSWPRLGLPQRCPGLAARPERQEGCRPAPSSSGPAAQPHPCHQVRVTYTRRLQVQTCYVKQLRDSKSTKSNNEECLHWVMPRPSACCKGRCSLPREPMNGLPRV